MLGSVRKSCVKLSRRAPWWWPMLLLPFVFLRMYSTFPLWPLQVLSIFAFAYLFGLMLDSSRFVEVEGVE